MVIRKLLSSFLFTVFCLLFLAALFYPFAKKYIYSGYPVGDEPMHLANMLLFKNYHSFPVSAWQGEWYAGYPLVEGYPWVHYYLIQPIITFLGNAESAMNLYSVAGLLLYIEVSFLLLLHVSKNKLFALFLTLLLLYGDDSGISLFRGGYFVFTVSQFFLPLTLLFIIMARDKGSNKLFLVANIIFSLSFFSDSTITEAFIIPAILPFLLLNSKGKMTRDTFLRTIKFFLIFILLSSIPLFAQFNQYLQGINISHTSQIPINEIEHRFLNILLMNPLIIFLSIIFLLFLEFRKVHNSSSLKPFLISFIFIFIIFLFNVFNITPLAPILFSERTIWAISLITLVIFAKIASENSATLEHQLLFNVEVLGVILLYLFSILIIKQPFLTPKTLKESPPKTYLRTNYQTGEITDQNQKYHLYTNTSWAQSFDNYRIDGVSYTTYAAWNLFSKNQRFNGWFLALKGLPLKWAELEVSGIQGRYGDNGKSDESQSSINRTLFFLDWYGIRHIEENKHISVQDLILAPYLKNESLIEDKKEIGDLVYYNLKTNLIGPIYAPTKAKTIAVISGEEQYDNLIRSLSYTKYNSQSLIPLYLGSKLNSLVKKEFKYYDAVLIYGYKNTFFDSKSWQILSAYVKEGGNLIIDTGQKVNESESKNLPDVFPISYSKLDNITDSWNARFENSPFTKEVDYEFFTPLKYNYSPFTISKSPLNSLKDWAKPIIEKGGDVVMAYGNYGDGKIFWSGLNLPFQIRDTRNLGEVQIISNVLDWFFPNLDQSVSHFNVKRFNPENIIISGEPSKGVLVKENYNPGWRARLNGKNVKIYKAGLFLMYIPINGKGNDFTLILKYKGNPLYWILFTETIITCCLIIYYLVTSKKLHLFPKLKPLKIFSSIKTWKNEENEY